MCNPGKPGKETLYDALGVGRDASQADIRKAYLRLAVQLHPDKNPGDETAKGRFQSLQKLYAVLSDPEKRRVYDATGSVEDSEELAGGEFEELYAFYRGLYQKVDEEDVARFEAQFRGSAEEAGEVLAYYARFGGDMAKVFEWVMCSYPDHDAHRYADIVEAAVAEGRAQASKKFQAWAKRARRKPRPANEVEPPSRKKQKKGGGGGDGDGDGMGDLVAQIRKRQQGAFDATFAAIEAKYAGAGRGTVDARYEEPSEEEFEKARQQLEAKRAKAAGGAGPLAAAKAKRGSR